jgi:hypothetical protein
VTWHLTRKNLVGHRAQVGAYHVWPLDQGVEHLAGPGHEGGGASGAQRTGDIPGMGRDEPNRTWWHTQSLGRHTNFRPSCDLFGKKNLKGYGHWHLNIDTMMGPMMGMGTLLLMGCTHTATVFTEGLRPGRHKLFALLVDDQHAPLMPEVATSVTINVNCRGDVTQDRMIVLVGVLPTFTQVPPACSRSITAVRRPARARAMESGPPASGPPACPSPIMIAS